MKPVWNRKGQKVYCGDCLDVLKQLPDASAHCVVTSPPYYGLRDYGTAMWVGGDRDCDHFAPPTGGTKKGGTLRGAGNRDGYSGDGQYRLICERCGAKRIDAQIGLEKTPEEYVEKMVAIFHEVWRVLRDDGTVWLNLGDSYASGPTGSLGRNDTGNHSKTFAWTGGNKAGSGNPGKQGTHNRTSGLKSKDLCGIPWRVAFALQADGWYLRQDIIWNKTSPMPESVTDRCTKAHEYVFLLTKKARYYYDADAIKETSICQPGSYEDKKRGEFCGKYDNPAAKMPGTFRAIRARRNKRSVWTVSSEGYADAHFATYPTKLIAPCIQAGTSEKGCCSDCGAPWRRVVRRKKLKRERPNDFVKRDGVVGTGNVCANTVVGVAVDIVRWEPTCECRGKQSKKRVTEETENGSVTRTISVYKSTIPLDDHPRVPCVVLDPFGGSGTTALVAYRLRRHSVMIELSSKYVQLIRKRLEPELRKVNLWV